MLPSPGAWRGARPAALFADFDDEFNRRVPVGSPPGRADEVRTELLPKYLGRLGAEVKPHFEQYQRALGEHALVYNKQTHEISDADIQASRLSVLKAAGFTSASQFEAAERAGAVSPRVKQQLKDIDNVIEWAGYLRGARYNAADVKAGVK
jgi:hypothetical protein